MSHGETMNTQEVRKMLHDLTKAFPRLGRKRFGELLRQPKFLELCCQNYREACESDPSVEETLGSVQGLLRFIEDVKRHGLERACIEQEKPHEGTVKRLPGWMRQAFSEAAKTLPHLPGGRPATPPSKREKSNRRRAKERIAEMKRLKSDGLSKREVAHRMELSVRTLQRDAKLLKPRETRLTSATEPIEE